MRILPASDASLIVTLGDTISRDVHVKVVRLFRSLREDGDERVRNLHPAYASIVVEFDPLRMTHNEAVAFVERAATRASDDVPVEFRRVEIPVCYGGEFGPDLPMVAQHANMSVDEVVEAHAEAEYFVCFIGFSPGFAYLGGLPERLATPRLASPRRVVPVGSVGIAGGQTGVYPVESPGGWQLIGRTPLRMFDSSASAPTRLQIGDLVHFRSIAREEYDALKSGAAGA